MHLNDQQQTKSRRALLVFADRLRRDLRRRGFPFPAEALLQIPEYKAADGGGADLHIFGGRNFPSADGASFHPQIGETFAERFENAVEALSASGYEEIVAIAVDCPHLDATDIATAFAELARRRLVLGPDHRGGCYLIALRSVDRAVIRGIRWNRNTDCRQLAGRVDRAELLRLAVKQDVDSLRDVALLSKAGGSIARVAHDILQIFRVFAATTPLVLDVARLALLERWQMPPPHAAA